MAGPHTQCVATVIKEKEAVGKQEKMGITATQSGLPKSPHHNGVSTKTLLKIIFLKLRIKLKFTVAFSAAFLVGQSHYGTQLLCSFGGQERPQTAHSVHYSTLTILRPSPTWNLHFSPQ